MDLCFDQGPFKKWGWRISHEIQILSDGSAHEYCVNFHTADVCVVTMKPDFFLPFHKNILACIFTSSLYLCLNIYARYYVSSECLVEFSFQNIWLAKNAIFNVGEHVYTWI